MTATRVNDSILEIIANLMPGFAGDRRDADAVDQLVYYIKLLTFSNDHKKDVRFLELED